MALHRLYNQPLIHYNIINHLRGDRYTFCRLEKMREHATCRFITQLTNGRHSSTFILSSLRPESQHRLDRYLTPSWGYILASGLSSRSRNVNSKAAENKTKIQSNGRFNILTAVVKKRFINGIEYMKSRRKDFRASESPNKSEKVESDDSNKRLWRIFRYFNPKKKYIEALRSKISRSAANAESEALTGEIEDRSRINWKIPLAVAKRGITGISDYVGSKRRNIAVTNSSSKSENAMLKAVKDNREYQSSTNRKILKISLRERLRSIMGYIGNTTKYMSVSGLFRESNNPESKVWKNEEKLQIYGYKKILEMASKRQFIKALRSSNEPDSSESEAINDAKIQHRSNFKVLESMGLGFFDESKTTESTGVSNRRKFQFYNEKMHIATEVRKIVLKLDAVKLEKSTEQLRDKNKQQRSTHIAEVEVESCEKNGDHAAGEKAAIAKPGPPRNSIRFDTYTPHSFPSKEDLELLPKTTEQLPGYELSITIDWKKDIGADNRVLETDGSRKAELRNLLLLELKRKIHEQNIFISKGKPRDNNHEERKQTESDCEDRLFSECELLQLQLMITNGGKFILKHSVLLYLGPFSVYSATDIFNQFILTYTLDKFIQGLEQFERKINAGEDDVRGARDRTCENRVHTEREAGRRKRYCEYCGSALHSDRTDRDW